MTSSYDFYILPLRAMDSLQLLPIKQAAFIVKLLNQGGIGFAEGRSEGSTAKDLRKRGWIEPFGRTDRRVRWKLNKIFSQQETQLLRALSDTDPYYVNLKE